MPAGFDARVEQIRKAVGVPGMSVAIVENGQVTLARGYGVRRLGEDAPVDADTIFQLGSVGKAFTTAALAVLVDRGQIDWDDPVTKHIPWFQMYDPWVTREMKVVDLLVHRSGLGLGAGDLMFVPRSNLSRAETVRRLRYIRPATSFRSAYAYDNVLYAVAGQLIEEVTGKTWERFMREDVLVPAGMRTATSDRVERRRTPNRAWPHARRDGPMHGMGTQKPLDDSGKAEFDPELGANAAPAGGVAASANDMGRWIAIQLARGALPGGSGRLFSEAASRQMWTPRVHVPISRIARSHRRGDAAVQRLRAGLDGAGLSRAPAHDAHRRGLRRAGDHHVDPRARRRLLGGDQLRGRRSRAGDRLRAARPLPRSARLRLGRRLAAGRAGARRAGRGAA